MSKTFEFHGNEEKLYEEFCKRHIHPEVNKGAIGGNISVTFTMTSIGTFPSVHCSICGETENITDYSTL